MLAALALALQVAVASNVRVSTDSEKAHFEPMIASAGNGVLIASGNLTGGDDGAWITKPYVSRDNGNTWVSVWIPELISSDGAPLSSIISGDSAVAAGARGRLFFASLCTLRFRAVHDLSTCLYRSDDAGRTWKRTMLNIGDHERFYTDPARGIVMLTGKGTGEPQRLVLYVSHDNGTTFSPPLTYAKAVGIAYDPCVLADGSIFLPFLRETHTNSFMEGVILTHYRDISAPFRLYDEGPTNYKALTARYQSRLVAGKYPEQAAPVFLSSASMLYSVTTLYKDGAYRLVLRRSRDGGHHWNAPQFVAPGGMTDQFAPSATVNANGVLGIAWSQMTAGTAYDERFIASLDRGATFTPARIISTRDSQPFNDQNVAGAAVGDRKGFFQVSGFTTRPSGGDYFGMTADEHGVFHPLWIDSRDGAGAQMYTAALDVSGVPPAACTPRSASPQVLKSAALLFDPSQFDARSGILTIPMRLHNSGHTPITAPVTYTVSALQAHEMISVKARIPAVAMPRITNASNGKTGAGATFDFSGAFGDYTQLPPGGVSNVVELRIKLANPLMAEPVTTGTFRGVVCE